MEKQAGQLDKLLSQRQAEPATTSHHHLPSTHHHRHQQQQHPQHGPTEGVPGQTMADPTAQANGTSHVAQQRSSPAMSGSGARASASGGKPRVSSSGTSRLSPSPSNARL